MRMTLKVALIAAMGFALSTQPALARNLVWNFEGTFTSVPGEYQALGLNAGDVISGTLQLNSNAKDAYRNDPVRGQYDLGKLTICVPALATCWTFSGPRSAQAMTILNDNPQSPPYDYFEIYGRDVPLDSIANATRLFFFNGPLPVDTFASDGVPLTPPPVSAFQHVNFQYTDTSISSGSSAGGTITTISSR